MTSIAITHEIEKNNNGFADCNNMQKFNKCLRVFNFQCLLISLCK